MIQILLEYFSQGIEHGHFHKSNIIPFSVLISLCLHALLEGVPLGGELEQHTHNALLYGIVLHKMPVAIVLMTFFLQSGMRKQRAYIFLLVFYGKRMDKHWRYDGCFRSISRFLFRS